MQSHLTSDDLSACALGLGSPEQSTRWSAHLETCDLCRRALRADQEMLRALKEYAEPEPSVGEWERMVRGTLAQSRMEQLPRTGSVLECVASLFPLWMRRLAVATLAFVAGYLLRGFEGGPVASARVSPAYSVATQHIRSLPLPHRMIERVSSQSPSGYRPDPRTGQYPVRVDDQPLRPMEWQ